MSEQSLKRSDRGPGHCLRAREMVAKVMALEISDLGSTAGSAEATAYGCGISERKQRCRIVDWNRQAP